MNKRLQTKAHSASVASHRVRAAIVAVALFAGPVFAQGPQKLKPPTPPATTSTHATTPPANSHELTATDLEAFLDGLVPLQIEADDVAGTVISVVKDGKILFAKGYGFSDVEKRKPVSASDTLFRPGSISKLFTWTSVMQLVQRGKLNLDQDVNTYLDFTIPPAFGKPITLRNIMTHTPGFQETIKELLVADAAAMRPLNEYLREHIPARIFPPGVTPAYSNYATSVAGYIVQRVSGKPFEQYVADNIYTPLGMPHSTFVQPLPPNLAPLMSNGYTRASEPAKPFEFIQAYPAGSVSTTATDMCNFMIAHLQNGQFGGAQILNPDVAELMHSANSHPIRASMAWRSASTRNPEMVTASSAMAATPYTFTAICTSSSTRMLDFMFRTTALAKRATAAPSCSKNSSIVIFRSRRRLQMPSPAPRKTPLAWPACTLPVAAPKRTS